MDIEPLSTQTINAVVELVLELWPECTVDEERDFYTQLIDAATDVCYLVKAGDAYVGFVHVSTRTDYVEGADESRVAYIEGIYVKPTYQNQGIARKLMQMAEDWAKQQGLLQMASDTEVSNAASIDFHKKVGFDEVERIVCFIKDLK